MASKNIKGICIEIDGNTTPLTKALKDVNSVIAQSNSELKNLNQALKLDPKNTELLSQKYEVLRNNIKATEERLKTLKEAQQQMGEYKTLTDEQKESYRALSAEITKTEASLKKMNNEAQQVQNVKLEKLQNALKKVGEVALEVSKKLLQISAAVAGALSGVVAAGVKSYAELEKAQKGSERLFGESFNIVKENAANAYKSLGLSATEYYDQVNQYAVGLKDALGGDSEAAAQLADDILKAQADITAATGASTDAVQNAFSAVMRGNYTLIDNLRLGIKGSKEGMQEAIDKVNEWNKANGNATNYQMGNYADMEKALVDYTKMVGIAGTAQTQLSTTIQGSVSQMKAAWDNFLNGSGSPEALVETITNVINNIATVLQDLAPSLLDGIVNLIQTLVPQVVSLIIDLLPQLLDAVTSLIDNLLELLSNNTESISKTISTIFIKIVEFIGENLPKIIEAAINLIVIFGEAMIDALPKLIEMLPKIITDIAEKLTDPESILKITDVALRLIVALAKGLIKALPELLKMPGEIIGNFVKKIGEVIKNTDWGKLGSDIIKGICDGFGRIGQYITNKVNEVKDAITNKFKSIFGIHSPSRLMRDTIGFNISAGIGEGIEEGIPEVLEDVNDAMKQLNAGIEASVNPTINPSMTYETNYVLMAKAMKDALQDMTIELDDENVGKFVVKTITNEVYS